MGRWNLTQKMIIMISTVAILLCTFGVGVGYQQYKRYIYSSYNTTAYQVAEIFAGMMTEGEINYYSELARQYKEGSISRDYLEQISTTRKYRRILEELYIFTEKMDLNDIFMVYVDEEELLHYEEGQEDWTPLVYIFDSYHDREAAYTFGDMGGINPIFLGETLTVLETGERSNSYFVSESQYGYNTSAILPIVYQGETIAIIGVEIPMRNLEQALYGYVRASVLSFVMVTLVIMGINVFYLYRALVKPVNIILEETKAFIRDDHRISKRLSEIRTGDEIQLLGESILQLEIDIDNYIHDITEMTRKNVRMGEELNVISDIAYRDALTGVKSSAAYQEEVDRINAELKRGEFPFGIVMFDINNLKIMNDTYGHKVGDNYIKNGCNLICTIFKHSPVYRIGGDEFVAILSGRDLELMDGLLEAFFREMERRIETAKWPEEKVFVAAGSARYDKDTDQDYQDVFRKADAQMYENKESLKQGKIF